MTAYGAPPLATGSHKCANVSLAGAVEPTTGARFLRDRPWLTTSAFPRGGAPGAEALPRCCHRRVRDKGASQHATAVPWPAAGTPGLLPPDRPALRPMGRLWRDLQAKGADGRVQTRDALAAVRGRRRPRAAQTALQSFTGDA
jgi:hypothetical protein